MTTTRPRNHPALLTLSLLALQAAACATSPRASEDTAAAHRATRDQVSDPASSSAAPLHDGLPLGVLQATGTSFAPAHVHATCQVPLPAMCIDYLFEGDDALALTEAHCKEKHGTLVYSPAQPDGARGCYNRDRALWCAYTLGSNRELTAFEFHFGTKALPDPDRCTLKEAKATPLTPPPAREKSVCVRSSQSDCIENDTDDPAWGADCTRRGGTFHPAPAECWRKDSIGACTFETRGERGTMVFHRSHPKSKDQLVEICEMINGTWQD
ncbi:hypothetical protein [Chondromyces crocatus]|uniref:Secreted protein n=1 Tax=Chondromyces crocatus TaxID=52 RepID=A0A0K1EK64_CHOCO|nr:hypothetical protein [Chondromyces crocatus]AKT41255.1 uncharacterized protein CMC5_054220 [Chondromyces crocatus]